MVEDTIQIKGSGIVSQIAFVKETFGESGYAQWVAALSASARALVESPVFASSWYEGDHAVFELREKICEVFYEGDPRGARHLGAYSAQKGLRGIYKAFVRLGAPEWIAGRATQVFGRYFKPVTLTPVVKDKGYLLMRLTDLTRKSEVFEETICGFTKKAIELSDGKDVSVERRLSLARGDAVTELESTWQF